MSDKEIRYQVYLNSKGWYIREPIEDYDDAADYYSIHPYSYDDDTDTVYKDVRGPYHTEEEARPVWEELMGDSLRARTIHNLEELSKIDLMKLADTCTNPEMLEMVSAISTAARLLKESK